MFLRYPLFQRLNTWSKPPALPQREARSYHWLDWNSLIADESADAALVPEFMDRTSSFPSRQEVAQALSAFAERGHVQVRYNCRWVATRRSDDGFILITSDGEYHAQAVVMAIGMAEPWKPLIPGVEAVPHYLDTKSPQAYADRRIFIIGKGNAAFEIADGLLPWARQLILASPRPPILSVLSAGAGVRARYLVPYEDHVIGGGVFILDAAIEKVERLGATWRVFTSGMLTGSRSFLVDEVIAATGVACPIGDLPALGVATFSQDRLPRMNAFWESTTVPGIYFAGTITQAGIGLRKFGAGGNSAAVGGFRHNARVLAVYLAGKFGVDVPTPRLEPDRVVPYLLSEATQAPELLNQKAYLARVVSFDRNRGIIDEGILPLAHFVDTLGVDGVAISVETDKEGRHHPVAYLRQGGHTTEHPLPPDPLQDFRGTEHTEQLAALLESVLSK